MAKDRRAHAVVFGFDFQVNAAIILMLENIEELSSLRLEGNYEDIELKLNDGQYILAQAKAIENASSDFKNVRKNLEKSLNSLSEGSSRVNAKQLILITNSPNPINEEASKSIFYGEAHRPYSSLPVSSKKLIDGYLSKISIPLDTEKFMIQVFPFETDIDAERYKVVEKSINDFIGALNLNIPGLGKKLMSIWHEDVFKNSTRKDADIILQKKDLVWPIIVIATDIERLDDDLSEYFDTCEYEEIVHQYRTVIDLCCEKFDFMTRVLYDYNGYQFAGSKSEKCVQFAMNRWADYLEELEIPNVDAETQKGLIQIILYSIVRNRIAINKIKKGVSL